ncbi:uncharacterized protein MELLADRAFT_85795 [Melampsora larici-populina 98AG31]|uniref:Uncharacterized protein n=1 Tax=Melampsora larici-populina (strain 98AG31 / pathotype 3-4-7) TaxID=747676 RepID=F4RJT2_MELLP|nr:uncharacterized protein MELLADRAFT_85795 [Melampsora larici-populina 98AG31]EGG07441.1 hypothetical protein MELLADRAFT_85795 [Melampsora larici-populina 98AG31]
MDNFKAPHVCNCEELGCGPERFELRGVLYTGKTRTRQNGEKHEAKLRRIRLKTSSSSNGQFQERNNLPARRRSLSTGDITANQAYIDQSMGPIVGAAQLGRRRSSSVETVQVSANHQNTQPPASITVSTAGFQRQQVYLQRPACLIAMLRVAHASIIQNAVHDDCRKSLHMAKLELAQSAKDHGYTGRPYWEDLPLSVPTLFTMLNLDVNMKTEVCCPDCFALHGQPGAKPDGTYKLNNPPALWGNSLLRHATQAVPPISLSIPSIVAGPDAACSWIRRRFG